MLGNPPSLHFNGYRMAFPTSVKHSDCEADHVQLIVGLRVRGAVPAVLSMILWYGFILHTGTYLPVFLLRIEVSDS